MLEQRLESSAILSESQIVTWNFSSSAVTRPWAWARGAWHRSMHWWTWDMESELRLQQSALQLNMRPCGEDTRHKVRSTRGGRDSRAPPRSQTTASPAFSGCGPSPGFGPSPPPRSACGPDAPQPSLFAFSVTFRVCRTNRTWGPGPEPARFTWKMWLYFINAKVTSIQAWSKARITPLPLYFRNFTREKKPTSCLCKSHTGFPQGKIGYLSVNVALFVFIFSQKYETNGIIELIRPFRKNTLSVCEFFSGADYLAFTIRLFKVSVCAVSLTF